MKAVLALILSFAAVSCAQEKQEKNTDERKRLANVTWDLRSHKLSWEVQKGNEVNGEFVANSSERYEITPDDAVMAFATERRGFTEAEAASLHKLLDTLSLYCAESVVWWDQGQGRKLDDTEKTTPERKKKEPEPNREKVDEKPFPSPNTPKPNVASLDMVYSSEGQAAQRSFTAAAR
jgi:hypothetical protein